MALPHEQRLQGLLDRYETEHGESLWRRREDAAASAAFHKRFQELYRIILFPTVEQLVNVLRGRGLPATWSASTRYACDISVVKECLTLRIADMDSAVDQRPPDRLQAQGRGGRTRPSAYAASDLLDRSEMQPGVSVLADNGNRQVSLHIRSLRHPDQPRMTDLPLLEQWTTDLVAEELIGALEQVFFETLPHA